MWQLNFNVTNCVRYYKLWQTLYQKVRRNNTEERAVEQKIRKCNNPNKYMLTITNILLHLQHNLNRYLLLGKNVTIKSFRYFFYSVVLRCENESTHNRLKFVVCEIISEHFRYIQRKHLLRNSFSWKFINILEFFKIIRMETGRLLLQRIKKNPTNKKIAKKFASGCKKHCLLLTKSHCLTRMFSGIK